MTADELNSMRAEVKALMERADEHDRRIKELTVKRDEVVKAIDEIDALQEEVRTRMQAIKARLRGAL